MLVLGLMVIIGALARPALDGPLMNQQLIKAADQVRAAWTMARNRSMKYGVTYKFTFQHGTGNYSIEPWSTDSDYVESSSAVMGGVSAGLVPLAATNTAPSMEKSLPARTAFHSLVASVSNRDVVAESAEVQLNQPDVGWSAPIMFYPDGTSSNAELTINNDRGRFVRIKVRGLTGLASVSDPFSQAELMP